MSRMALSFSRLTCFEQCPAKFDYLYVSKSIQDQDNEHTLYGTRIHEGLEKYGRGLCGDDVAAAEAACADDTEWGKFRGLVDRIVARPGDKYFEYQMALDANRNPCDWFAPEVWLRGIADVLTIDGAKACVWDWKTGKIKPNPTQLQLFALMAFTHFPAVQEVKSGFVWLKHDDITATTYTRSMAPALWSALLPRFDKVQESVDLGVFDAKPSGLCRWCPAQNICPKARV